MFSPRLLVFIHECQCDFFRFTLLSFWNWPKRPFAGFGQQLTGLQASKRWLGQSDLSATKWSIPSRVKLLLKINPNDWSRKLKRRLNLPRKASPGRPRIAIQRTVVRWYSRTWLSSAKFCVALLLDMGACVWEWVLRSGWSLPPRK